jgi:putative ABC transport system permease protein
MDRLSQEIRHALRALRKAPGFTALVVFTLAIGIGANTAMFSIVNSVLLQPLPFDHPERVVDIAESAGRAGLTSIPPASFLDTRQMTTSFEAMSAYLTRSYNVAPPTGEPANLRGTMASTTFFDVLGIAPILGRGFVREDAEPGREQVIVLSFGYWQRQFGGDRNIVNQSVRLNAQAYTVIGVMPATLNFPDASNFWIPARYDVPVCGAAPNQHPRDQRGVYCLRAVGRLKPQVRLSQANAEFKTVSDHLARQYPDHKSLLVAVPLQERLVGATRAPLLVLLGAVACVLLIVVANVANLMMARATARGRELSLRAAIGASKAALIRQLLVESALLALFGGVLGVLLAFWGLNAMLALEPADLPRVAPIEIDRVVLGVAGLVSIATGLLFGMLPARHAATPLHAALNEGLRGTTGDRRRHRSRALLVLIEVATCVVLLVGAGLLFRTLLALLETPLGFTTTRVLTLNVAPVGDGYRSREQLLSYWNRALERIATVSGVERVTVTGSLPMSGVFPVIGYRADNGPALPVTQWPTTNFVEAGSHYFATMDIAVLRGRDFGLQDMVLNPSAVIINDALARRDFGDEDPIGHRLAFGLDAAGNPAMNWEIVAVVGNVRHNRADQEPVPIAYTPFSLFPGGRNLMIRTAGEPMAVAGQIRAAVQSLDATLPVSPPRTLDEVIGESLKQRRFNMTLLAVFAAVALVMAVAGIYGTVAYAVVLRTQEIGIRIALGATRREVLRMVLATAMQPVVGGLVCGVIASAGLTRLLTGLLYGVSPIDSITFVSLPAFLAVVALLAAWLPALRATRIDPLNALRAD